MMVNIEIVPPALASGTRPLRITSSGYRSASWKAWPASCAAMPTAASDRPSYTAGLRRSTFFCGRVGAERDPWRASPRPAPPAGGGGGGGGRPAPPPPGARGNLAGEKNPPPPPPLGPQGEEHSRRHEQKVERVKEHLNVSIK